MMINHQKELVLRPGDRIWFKSSIYGDRYYDAVIKAINPGPGRTICTNVFESPTRCTSIQKYELKDGEKVNMFPPAGRIMMRFWTLQPGKYDAASCPFSELASSFVKVAKEARKDVSGQGQMYLKRFKDPRAMICFKMKTKLLFERRTLPHIPNHCFFTRNFWSL